MIQCERCDVWQHGACVGVLRSQIPDNYECEQCNPQAYHERIEKKKDKEVKKRKNGKGRPSSDGVKRSRVDPAEMNTTDLLNAPADAKLTREQRKMQNILKSIELLENREKKGENVKKRPKASFTSQTKAPRRISRHSSTRKDASIDSMIQTKEALSDIYPLSPMYLGKKIWISHMMQEDPDPLENPNHVCYSFKKMMLENVEDANYDYFETGKSSRRRRRKNFSGSFSKEGMQSDSIDYV